MIKIKQNIVISIYSFSSPNRSSVCKTKQGNAKYLHGSFVFCKYKIYTRFPENIHGSLSQWLSPAGHRVNPRPRFPLSVDISSRTLSQYTAQVHSVSGHLQQDIESIHGPGSLCQSTSPAGHRINPWPWFPLSVHSIVMVVLSYKLALHSSSMKTLQYIYITARRFQKYE